tara:strand:- start:1481 stop:6244 length:4764 start_codon:yes stop_codon:yes gene_type:complete
MTHKHRLNNGFCRGLFAAAGLVATTASYALPEGFTKKQVLANLDQATAIRFAPKDSRVFVAEKDGAIRVFDSINDTTSDLVYQIDNVHTNTDHGLLGLAIHPDFPQTPFIYALYSRRVGSPGAHLSKITVENGVGVSEEILIQGWCQQSTSHAIGDLQFGPDGALYVTSGDGASPSFVDVGPDGCGDPNMEGGAVRVQDFRTEGDGLDFNGTLLRLDPITGQAMPGNPLFGAQGPEGASRSRVIAYGLRNPFRFTIHPETSALYIADVGWNQVEEINVVPDPTDGVIENFGWPCFEGSGRQGGYDGANIPLCESLYNQGGDTKPFSEYNHNGRAAGVTGVAVYTGNSYPAEYQGALFFADYSQQWIKVIMPGADGQPNPNDIQDFDNGDPIVQLLTGPNGDLFYVEYDLGANQYRVWQVSAINQANPVIAQMQANPSYGAPGTSVSFDASTTAGATLYEWDLDGDGLFDDATGVNAQSTYGEAGTYMVSVRASDNFGNSDTSHQIVFISEDVPVPSITAPATTVKWQTEETVNFAGTAVIPNTGETTDNLEWDLFLHHCAKNDPTDCHLHDEKDNIFVTSPNGGSFPGPDHEYPSHLELKLTAFSDTAPEWWDTAWQKRRALFINATDIDETLFDFPLMVKLDSSRVDYAATGDQGQSLRFVDRQGNALAHDIESWNPAGESVVWVKVPVVNANSVANYIWMYYDNAQAIAAQNSADVWNNDYAGVWHMATADDASGQQNNANNQGASPVTGAAGTAQFFDGDDFMVVPNSASLNLTNAMSFSAWIKVQDPAADNWGRILSKKEGFNDNSGFNFEYNAGQNFLTTLAGGQNLARAEGVDLPATWNLVSASINGNNVALYVNGQEVTTDGIIDPITPNNLDLSIGRSALGGNFFNGSIDELRISSVARSAAWMQAQHRSMSDNMVKYATEAQQEPMSASISIELQPVTVEMTMDSEPSGLMLSINSRLQATPFVDVGIVGSTSSIGATSPQLLDGEQFEFSNWNIGGDANQIIFNPAIDTSYVATYESTGVVPCNFQTMNYRGTSNGWQNSPMQLVGACTWGITVALDGGGLDRFKFDVAGDWAQNFGDDNADGIAELVGEDIFAPAQGAGDYQITFNDDTLAYTVTKLPDGPAAPIAAANAPAIAKTGEPFTLDGSSSSDADGDISSYVWSHPEWNDTLSGEVVEAVFNSAGEKVITLTVTDSTELASTTQVTIDVLAPAAPVAVIEADKLTVALNQPVVLDASNSSDANQDPLSFAWSTGETAAQISLAFDSVGEHIVDVTVTDSDDLADTASITIVVEEQPFLQNFDQVHLRGTFNGFAAGTLMELVGDNLWQIEATFNGAANDRFKFDIDGNWANNYGDNNDDGIAEFFGDDIFVAQAGSYVIQFNDESLAYSVTLLQGNQPPVVVLNMGNTTVTPGTTLTIDASDSDDPDGTIDSLAWSTGDTTSSITQTFDAIGSFDFTVTVTDNEGATAAETITITVAEPNVEVDITFTCDNGNTVNGQSVYVVGNIPELGNWTATPAQKLDPTAWPTWSGTLNDMPANTDIDWKCVIADEETLTIVQWQGGANNQVTTGAQGNVTTQGAF